MVSVAFLDGGLASVHQRARHEQASLQYAPHIDFLDYRVRFDLLILISL